MAQEKNNVVDKQLEQEVRSGSVNRGYQIEFPRTPLAAWQTEPVYRDVSNDIAYLDGMTDL